MSVKRPTRDQPRPSESTCRRHASDLANDLSRPSANVGLGLNRTRCADHLGFFGPRRLRRPRTSTWRPALEASLLLQVAACPSTQARLPPGAPYSTAAAYHLRRAVGVLDRTGGCRRDDQAGLRGWPDRVRRSRRPDPRPLLQRPIASGGRSNRQRRVRLFGAGSADARGRSFSARSNLGRSLRTVTVPLAGRTLGRACEPSVLGPSNLPPPGRSNLPGSVDSSRAGGRCSRQSWPTHSRRRRAGPPFPRGRLPPRTDDRPSGFCRRLLPSAACGALTLAAGARAVGAAGRIAALRTAVDPFAAGRTADGGRRGAWSLAIR